MYCPGHARDIGHGGADRVAGKATITTSLRLGRPEVLWGLRHYQRAQSQGHQHIDHLEEKGVNTGSAPPYSLKGQERVIANQINTGIVSKAMLRRLTRDGVERIWASPSA